MNDSMYYQVDQKVMAARYLWITRIDQPIPIATRQVTKAGRITIPDIF